jgi:hypothetical protein
MYFLTDQIAGVSDFQLVNLKCKERNSFAGRKILFIFLVNLSDLYKIYIVKMSFVKDASLTSIGKDYSCRSLGETQYLSPQLST